MFQKISLSKSKGFQNMDIHLPEETIPMRQLEDIRVY
jgi:hypothetical protein